MLRTLGSNRRTNYGIERNVLRFQNPRYESKSLRRPRVLLPGSRGLNFSHSSPCGFSDTSISSQRTSQIEKLQGQLVPPCWVGPLGGRTQRYVCGRTQPYSNIMNSSNDRRICWGRPGAASSAEQRFKIHRSFRRYTTSWKKSRRRMGSKVGGHRSRFPALAWPSPFSTASKKRSRPRRGESSKAALRAPERQEEEVGDDQDHVLVHPC